MITLTTRNVDPDLKERLRLRAAKNGRSLQAELQVILARRRMTTETDQKTGFVDLIHARMLPFNGVDLNAYPRTVDREPPTFD
jgi:plasmid stability protein